MLSCERFAKCRTTCGSRKLGQGRGRGGQRAGRQQFLDRPLRHIARRQPMRTAAGFGEFEQQFGIAGVTHDSMLHRLIGSLVFCISSILHSCHT